MLWGGPRGSGLQDKQELNDPIPWIVHSSVHFSFQKIFIWIYLAVQVLAATVRIFHLLCSMLDPAPWLGIEPGSLAFGVPGLSHSILREVPIHSFLCRASPKCQADILGLWSLAWLLQLPAKLTKTGNRVSPQGVPWVSGFFSELLREFSLSQYWKPVGCLMEIKNKTVRQKWLRHLGVIIDKCFLRA